MSERTVNVVPVERRLSYAEWMLLDRIRVLDGVPRDSIAYKDWSWLEPGDREEKDGSVTRFEPLAVGNTFVRITDAGIALLESQPKPSSPVTRQTKKVSGRPADLESREKQIGLL